METTLMMLGLESGIVRLVPYDPAWPGLFSAEEERLQKLFAAAGLVVTLEHTGSTAIPRSYHLHLAAIDSPFWRDHITFRNHLRAAEALRDAYAALKHDLAARFPRDREAYIEAKAPFVKDILRR